jgi:ABC-type enterochelin transport system ATPase subunit
MDMTEPPALMTVDSSVKLTVIAKFTDGSSRDVTVDAVWVSHDTNVASVLSGQVTALKSGTAYVEATYRNGHESVLITVK